jgi:hypothetical protein
VRELVGEEWHRDLPSDGLEGVVEKVDVIAAPEPEVQQSLSMQEIAGTTISERPQE